MSSNGQTREEFIAEMTAKGMIASMPAPNELFVDLDTEEQFKAFVHLYKIFEQEHLQEFGESPSKLLTQSSSGEGHYHVRIKLAYDLTPELRIALQGALGSDPARELLSIVRLRRGDIYPTLFIESPEMADTLEEWENQNTTTRINSDTEDILV